MSLFQMLVIIDNSFSTSKIGTIQKNEWNVLNSLKIGQLLNSKTILNFNLAGKDIKSCFES